MRYFRKPKNLSFIIFIFTFYEDDYVWVIKKKFVETAIFLGFSFSEMLPFVHDQWTRKHLNSHSTHLKYVFFTRFLSHSLKHNVHRLVCMRLTRRSLLLTSSPTCGCVISLILPYRLAAVFDHCWRWWFCENHFRLHLRTAFTWKRFSPRF